MALIEVLIALSSGLGGVALLTAAIVGQDRP